METHIITGRIAREVRSGNTKNNKPYVSFTVASEKKFQDKTFTSYHGFMAYGEEANVASRLGVNDLVQVMSNEVRAETYEKKDTKEVKASLSYTARQIEVLSTASQQDASAKQESVPQRSSPGRAPATPKPAPASENIDEDVPF